MKPPKLTVLYQNMPYPADRGGKADVWRRLQAFKARGAHVQLIHWPPGGAEGLVPEARQVLTETVEDLLPLRPCRNLSKIAPWDLLHIPFQVTKWRLAPSEKAMVASRVAAFDPDAIWIEGPWTAETGLWLSETLKRPLLYRSHNIEHKYMPSQARATKGRLARWMIFASNFHLERLERRAMAKAQRIYDISNDDLEWWRGQGVTHNEWLPPVAEAALSKVDATIPKDLDVLFFGNLVTPNNLRGVEWLLGEVWPKVKAVLPGANLTIAGSRPGRDIVERIQGTEGTSLLANVPDVLAVIRRAKVHANPVLTGSGIQLKTVEMLMTDAPVVSTPQGVAGFPDWVKEDVGPIGDPEGFARKIVDHLVSGSELSPTRRKTQELFAFSSIDSVLSGLNQL